MSYNDIFSNLIKLFLAKIYDEETTGISEPYRFQIEFHDGEPETPESVFTRIDDLYDECRAAYLGYTSEEIAKSVGIDREKISASKVAHVVGQLQGISLRENRYASDADILGDFFEGIVSDGFKQDKGQFFTHKNIVSFMLNVLQLRELARDLVTGKENPAKPRLPYICDPSCGSGTFLISAMKAVTQELQGIQTEGGLSYKTREFLASNFPQFTPNVWAKEFVYGVEPHADLAMATKVNMVLHGDGNINVFRRSGLLPFSEYRLTGKVSVLAQRLDIQLRELKGVFAQQKKYTVNEQFDVVITNPPFSVDLDQDTKKLLPGNFLFAERPDSEVLFVERWYQLLREGGRVAAILPDSIFDNKDEIEIRVFLYRFFHLRALVSLPMLAFQPYTPTKTSILFAQKKTAKEVEAFDNAWNEAALTTKQTRAAISEWAYSKDISQAASAAIRLILSLQLPEGELSQSSDEELVAAYSSLIKEACASSYWLTFALTAEKVRMPPLLVAHAEQVGYKRSKKIGEMPRPNQLFDDPKALNTEDVDPAYPRIQDFLAEKVAW
jgi:type I restriction enzyme M protein